MGPVMRTIFLKIIVKDNSNQLISARYENTYYLRTVFPIFSTEAPLLNLKV